MLFTLIDLMNEQLEIQFQSSQSEWLPAITRPNWHYSAHFAIACCIIHLNLEILHFQGIDEDAHYSVTEFVYFAFSFVAGRFQIQYLERNSRFQTVPNSATIENWLRHFSVHFLQIFLSIFLNIISPCNARISRWSLWSKRRNKKSASSKWLQWIELCSLLKFICDGLSQLDKKYIHFIPMCLDTK